MDPLFKAVEKKLVDAESELSKAKENLRRDEEIFAQKMKDLQRLEK
jgi:hypothetical protein